MANSRLASQISHLETQRLLSRARHIAQPTWMWMAVYARGAEDTGEAEGGTQPRVRGDAQVRHGERDDRREKEKEGGEREKTGEEKEEVGKKGDREIENERCGVRGNCWLPNLEGSCPSGLLLT